MKLSLCGCGWDTWFMETDIGSDLYLLEREGRYYVMTDLDYEDYEEECLFSADTITEIFIWLG